MESVWSVGLMTGTALDGNIDVSLIRTDGESVQEFGHWNFIPYKSDTVEIIRDAYNQAQNWNFSGVEPKIFAEAEKALTISQAEAVKATVESAGMSMSDIAIVGFHGQTVLHRAPMKGVLGQTRQLCDGKLMCKMLNLKVAYDFRTRDMELGGQGAPLSPVYHVALLRAIDADSEFSVVNLGGVANLTWWGGGNRIIGFDTGPANAPINDWVSAHGMGSFDKDGRLAESGTVDENRLSKLLEHPYFLLDIPKSLDRNSFTASMADGLSAENGAATLTAFSASAIDKSLNCLPNRPNKLILCGGGRKNPTLVREIEKRANVETIDSDSLGWRGDALEAECFAYLAVRVLHRLPISFPHTTGVSDASIGGRLAIP